MTKKRFDSKRLTSIFSENYLSNYSHMKIGGKPKYLFLPEQVNDLKLILEFAKTKKHKIIPIGGGSNILFGSVKNKVFIVDYALQKYFKIVKNEVTVSANYNINSLIRDLAKENLGGLEFLSSIPAHIGGLLVSNAAAFGKKISSFLQSVKILTKQGQGKIITKEEIDFDYRYSSLQDYIIEAKFNLESIAEGNVLEKIFEFRKIRKSKQPWGLPNLGSIFKNPDNAYAGRLIEDCGLKGFKIGGAKISRKHANFIVNYDNATFDDVYNLIKLIRKKVLKEKGIELEPEIRIVN